MSDLFFRHGGRFEGVPHIEGGKAFAVLPHICGRCGGAGGADKWKHTGWTCFQCGGRGHLGTKAHPLFTAEKLAKLNAAAEKRAATKAAAAAVKRAAEAAEVEARKEAFLAEHGALLQACEAFEERSEFIKDVHRKAVAAMRLSPAQADALRAAIAKIEASDAKKAASEHVGTIGERLTLTVTAERVTTIETRFGALHIAAMRTAEGDAIVTKGRFVPPTAHWTEERGWKVEPAPFTIKGTVKEHDEFRGEKNTILARAAVAA